MTVLVEGFDRDQIGLARHLARQRAPAPAAPAGSATESPHVRLAGPGPAPAEALALTGSHGIRVEPYIDLDADPGPAEIAYLDVWTPDVAPRVRKLRERGALVTSIGDLLLERAEGVTIGITGTAGKTTAATITRQLLLSAGVNVDASSTGRLGNVWPTAELLDREESDRPLLLELTSSHLAFMRNSPRIAAITCFWPDHLELHGSLDAYRAAKETIVRGQRTGDTVVVHADDPGAASFAEITPAQLVEVSLARPVEHGVCVQRGRVLIHWDDGETDAGALDRLPAGVPQRVDALVALAVAVAAGAQPAALARALDQGVELPAYRSRLVGVLVGVPVIDDGMAATPSKTAATLAAFPAGRIVLIAGGIDDLGTGPVHAAPLERELLERACDVVARSARLVVLFGPASRRLEPLLVRRNVPTVVTDALDEAFDAAARSLSGANALVFSPMFPAEAPDRERFAILVNGRQAGAGLEEK